MNIFSFGHRVGVCIGGNGVCACARVRACVCVCMYVCVCGGEGVDGGFTSDFYHARLTQNFHSANTLPNIIVLFRPIYM